MIIVMALIAAGLLILPFSRRKAKSYKNFLLDNVVWIAVFAFIFGVGVDMAGFEDSWLYDQMIEVVAVLLLGSPYFIFRNIARKKKKPQEVPVARTQPYIAVPEEKINIPASVAGRMKIVRKFNNKYNLTLTETEMEKIVNGSFHSKDWAKEIEAMNRNYMTETEWYVGETGWLRAYLKAFNVQNVSSDFSFQKEVCLNNFNQVFSSMDMSVFSSNDDCVRAINDRFMTNFNEMSFMIAYRFLEMHGKKYNLPQAGIVSVDTELAQLERKYQTQVMR